MPHTTISQLVRAAALTLTGALLVGPPPAAQGAIAPTSAPGDRAPIAARGTGETLRQCSSDRSLSFKTCVTMNYSTSTLDGQTIVKLANYKYVVRRIDPSQLVQAPKLQAKMGIHAFCRLECGGLDSRYVADVIDRAPTPPRIGKVYTYRPSWAGRWFSVADDGFYLCGNAKLTVKRRSSTWTDQLPNVCQGAPSLPYP